MLLGALELTLVVGAGRALSESLLVALTLLLGGDVLCRLVGRTVADDIDRCCLN